MYPSTIGEFVEGLAKELWASISSFDLALLAALACHRRDPAERRQAVSIFPAVFLRTKRAEQAWRERRPGRSNKEWVPPTRARKVISIESLTDAARYALGDYHTDISGTLAEIHAKTETLYDAQSNVTQKTLSPS